MEIQSNQLTQFVEEGIGFVKRTGLTVVEMKKGYVKLLVPMKGNENHIGSMYAGALFTLAEIPGGALYLTTFDMERFYPVVKEMTLSFRKPVKCDATIEISLSEEEIQRIEETAADQGKCDFILAGEILDTSGKVVARSKGLYQLRSWAI